MIRGTTPTHTFTLPIETSTIKEALVTYAQKENVLFEKSTEDCTMSENKITVVLTQEETFKFDCKSSAQVQLRVLTTEGKAMASDVLIVPVETCLSKVVLE